MFPRTEAGIATKVIQLIVHELKEADEDVDLTDFVTILESILDDRCGVQ